MGEFIEANNVHEDVWHRKTLRPLTQILIPEVEFRRQPKANEPDRLSIKKTRDNIIHLVEKKSKDDSNKWMYCLKLPSCYGKQSMVAQNGCFQ